MKIEKEESQAALGEGKVLILMKNTRVALESVLTENKPRELIEFF